jgi:hypothetical protein
MFYKLVALKTCFKRSKCNNKSYSLINLNVTVAELVQERYVLIISPYCKFNRYSSICQWAYHTVRGKTALSLMDKGCFCPDIIFFQSYLA